MVLGKASSVPLPDEIAKELEVLSGFSNVTTQQNFDENQGFQVPPAPSDTNYNQSKSQSRIGKFENKCTEFCKMVSIPRHWRKVSYTYTRIYNNFADRLEKIHP